MANTVLHGAFRYSMRSILITIVISLILTAVMVAGPLIDPAYSSTSRGERIAGWSVTAFFGLLTLLLSWIYLRRVRSGLRAFAILDGETDDTVASATISIVRVHRGRPAYLLTIRYGSGAHDSVNIPAKALDEVESYMRATFPGARVENTAT